MDTGSRLEEPGDVGWKDVNIGRLRKTTSDKRLISLARAGARSDLAKELDLRDSVLLRWVEQRGTGWSGRRRRGAPPSREGNLGMFRIFACAIAITRRDLPVASLWCRQFVSSGDNGGSVV